MTQTLVYTHGAECLDIFAMHVREGFDPSAAVATTTFQLTGANGVQRRVRVKDWGGMSGTSGLEKVQAMCLVRGLYQAIRSNPGKEAGILPVVDGCPISIQVRSWNGVRLELISW